MLESKETCRIPKKHVIGYGRSTTIAVAPLPEISFEGSKN